VVWLNDGLAAVRPARHLTPLRPLCALATLSAERRGWPCRRETTLLRSAEKVAPKGSDEVARRDRPLRAW